MNKNGQGVDQTWKLLKYFPEIDPRIKSLHCEVLVKMEHGFGEKSRQKANGLVNSTKDEMLQDVEDYINIRAFRYFTDYEGLDYIETMRSLSEVRNQNGDIKFAPGCCMTFNEIFGLDSPYSLSPKELDSDVLETSTGTFLIDGWVAYTKSGEVIKALKYKDAGRGEFSKVIEIKWNNLLDKDGFSSNIIIEPVYIRGVKVTKPTGGAQKIFRDNISKGALVSVTMRNSTIPCIENCLKGGNGDFNLPICECGYKLTENDIYGNNLKCQNPDCIGRLNRMVHYIEGKEINEIDLNKLLIVDRFDFDKKINKNDLLNKIIYYSNFSEFKELLVKELSYIKFTNIQKKMINLQINPLVKAIKIWNSKRELNS
jgi:hypothetical protein